MCVLFIAVEQREDFPLVIAANRDEFYERPTAKAAWWEDYPDIYAGRDLVAKGTWMGINRNGRFAALTNYRDPDQHRGTVSRGALVANFLEQNETPENYLRNVEADATKYTGFNLIVGEYSSKIQQTCYYSNRGDTVRILEPGVYGLSNHLLDTPWPKVRHGKETFGGIIRADELDSESLFRFLSNPNTASDEELPETGVGIERERLLSALFIETPIYGTRNTTLVTIDNQGNSVLDERVYV